MSKGWAGFDEFYARAYAADLARDNAGEFDALRSLMETPPKGRWDEPEKTDARRRLEELARTATPEQLAKLQEELS
jgi:hypothetical protein